MKRNTIIMGMTALLLLTLTACTVYQTNFENVKINYEASDVHKKEDIDDAAKAVFDEFSQFDDAVLYSLTYSGDETSENNIAYCQELLKDKKIVDCIVFKSNFKTSKWAKPAWEPNTEYDWDWYVAKDSNGNWTVATYGYC